ncbi:MAG: DUF3783 domain-containing protein [Anaerostipes sp.]|nr:DUF3783 domain-containing protein [Anaerostipes sp.]
MKKQVLLYNISDKKRALDIRMILMPLKVRIKNVAQKDFIQPLGYILGLDDFEAIESFESESPFADEMMVLAGFTDYDIDFLIRGFRKLKIPGIPLKAVLTETNREWDSYRLYGDLKKEHESFQ